MKTKTKGGLVTTVASNEGCKIVEAHSGRTRNLTTGEILAIMNFEGSDGLPLSPPSTDYKTCKAQLNRGVIGNAKFKRKE